MSFWKYLVINRLWIMLTFIGICAGIAVGWMTQDSAAGPDIHLMLIIVASIIIAFLVGNFITWRRSRR